MCNLDVIRIYNWFCKGIIMNIILNRISFIIDLYRLLRDAPILYIVYKYYHINIIRRFYCRICMYMCCIYV